MTYYPNLYLEDGDRLVALNEDGWQQTAEGLGIEPGTRTIIMEFHGRPDDPMWRDDSFKATVNDQDNAQAVHIDVISNITGAADQYALYRN